MISVILHINILSSTIIVVDYRHKKWSSNPLWLSEFLSIVYAHIKIYAKIRIKHNKCFKKWEKKANSVF